MGHALASRTVCVCAPLRFSLVLADVEQDGQQLPVAVRPHMPTWANMAQLHASTHMISQRCRRATVPYVSTFDIINILRAPTCKFANRDSKKRATQFLEMYFRESSIIRDA